MERGSPRARLGGSGDLPAQVPRGVAGELSKLQGTSVDATRVRTTNLGTETTRVDGSEEKKDRNPNKISTEVPIREVLSRISRGTGIFTSPVVRLRPGCFFQDASHGT